MRYKDVPDLRRYLTDWTDEFALFRQNWLLGEGQFLTFARDRGLPVLGVNSGEPGDFAKRGWLHPDETDSNGEPRFHPFRIYPLHHILSACDLRIAQSTSLKPDAMLWLTKQMLDHLPPAERLYEMSQDWNNVTTLAIILEPLYWPDILGSRRFPGRMTDADFRKQLQTYEQKVSDLVRSLDSIFWRSVHECLRIEAAQMDDNPRLYMLLRVSNWYERERLRGKVSGALWIRHMAEVIRRGFEAVHTQQWPEEDEAFGRWFPGARKVTFGSDRPLDSALKAKPYLAHRFGLFTGSALRWYFEGDTEYFAVSEMVGEISLFGVELVNLKGGIASGKNNAPLQLEAHLKEDCSLRRFSMLSFDGDVPENVKYVRRQCQQGNIVGRIAKHDPDFEFANFSISELTEVAAKIDDDLSFQGDAVRDANWDGIKRAKDFEEKYLEVSTRKAGDLKGEAWGRALARYAMESPNGPDGRPRPLVDQVRAALGAWSSSYDRHRDQYTFDCRTFEPIKRPRET